MEAGNVKNIWIDTNDTVLDFLEVFKELPEDAIVLEWESDGDKLMISFCYAEAK